MEEGRLKEKRRVNGVKREGLRFKKGELMLVKGGLCKGGKRRRVKG